MAIDEQGGAAVVTGESVSAEILFDVQLRSFSVWGAGLSGPLPITGTPAPGCTMSANGAWALGSQDGLIVLIPTTAPRVVRRVVTPPAAGPTLGRALAMNPDASVFVMGEPGAADAGAVWMLWR